MMRIILTPSTEDTGKQMKLQLKPENKGSNKNKQDDSQGGWTHLKGVAKVKNFQWYSPEEVERMLGPKL